MEYDIFTTTQAAQSRSQVVSRMPDQGMIAQQFHSPDQPVDDAFRSDEAVLADGFSDFVHVGAALRGEMDARHVSRALSKALATALPDIITECAEIVIAFQRSKASFREIAVTFVDEGAECGEFLRTHVLGLLQPME